MTVKECYDTFGGDYNGALGRLMKDERIGKYLRMFAAGDDYTALGKALAEDRTEDAFRAVHNLKGISLNLGLTPMIGASETLCEALRHGKPDYDITDMVKAVDEAFACVTAAIANLQ